MCLFRATAPPDVYTLSLHDALPIFLKVLLALEAIEELDLKKVFIGTDDDAAIDGSAVGLGPGGRYTVEQLLQGLLMASGNEAAHALAQQLGGDQETLTKINKLATDLGRSEEHTSELQSRGTIV